MTSEISADASSSQPTFNDRGKRQVLESSASSSGRSDAEVLSRSSFDSVQPSSPKPYAESEEEWYVALYEEDSRRLQELLEVHPSLWEVGWESDPLRKVKGRKRNYWMELTESDWKGRTALHVGARRGNVDLLQKVLDLCKNGANAKDITWPERSLFRQNSRVNNPTAAANQSNKEANLTAGFHPEPIKDQDAPEKGLSRRESNANERTRDTKVPPAILEGDGDGKERSMESLLLAQDGEYKLDAIAMAIVNGNRFVVAVLLEAGSMSVSVNQKYSIRGNFLEDGSTSVSVDEKYEFRKGFFQPKWNADSSDLDGSTDCGWNVDGSADGGLNVDGSDDGGSNVVGSVDGGSNVDASAVRGSNVDGSDERGLNVDGSVDGGSNVDGSVDGGSNVDASAVRGSNVDGSDEPKKGVDESAVGGSDVDGSNEPKNGVDGSAVGGSNVDESVDGGSNVDGSAIGGSNVDGSNEPKNGVDGSAVGGSNEPKKDVDGSAVGGSNVSEWTVSTAVSRSNIDGSDEPEHDIHIRTRIKQKYWDIIHELRLSEETRRCIDLLEKKSAVSWFDAWQEEQDRRKLVRESEWQKDKDSKTPHEVMRRELTVATRQVIENFRRDGLFRTFVLDRYHRHRDFNFLPKEEFLFHFLATRYDDNESGYLIPHLRVNFIYLEVRYLYFVVQDAILRAVESTSPGLMQFLWKLHDGQGRPPLHVAVDEFNDPSSMLLNLVRASSGDKTLVGEILSTYDGAGRTALHRSIASDYGTAFDRNSISAFYYDDVKEGLERFVINLRSHFLEVELQRSHDHGKLEHEIQNILHNFTHSQPGEQRYGCGRMFEHVAMKIVPNWQNSQPEYLTYDEVVRILLTRREYRNWQTRWLKSGIYYSLDENAVSDAQGFTGRKGRLYESDRVPLHSAIIHKNLHACRDLIVETGVNDFFCSEATESTY